VHFWKFLVGFCAFLWSSKNAQNPMRNYQKGTKSQEKLPNMHKIRRGSSKNAQDLMIDFK
jgi:hypothetical protein